MIDQDLGHDIQALQQALDAARERLASPPDPQAWSELRQDLEQLSADLKSVARGIAAESARTAEEAVEKLNQDLDRRASQLAALIKSSQAITSTFDLATVLGLVISEVRSVLNAEGVSILLQEGQELVFAAASGLHSEGLRGKRMPVTEGIAGWVLREGRLAQVDRVSQDSRFYGGIDALTGLATHSVLAAPLIFKGVPRGVIEAINAAGGPFEARDAEMLEAIAGSASVAIENASLFAAVDNELFERRQAEEKLEQRTQALATLYEIAMTMAKPQDLHHLLAAVLNQILEMLQLDRGLIYVLEPGADTLELVAHQGLSERALKAMGRVTWGETLVGRIAASGQPVLVDETWEGPDRADIPAPLGSIRILAGVPIKSQERVMGVLCVSSGSFYPFRPGDLELLGTIGYHLGIAIENARLAEQAAEIQVLRELDRMRSELIANVSHELRTPLGLIKIISTTLLRQDITTDRATQIEFLRDIDQETERLEKVVESLLDISRLQSGKMRLDRRETDLGELIRHVMSDPEIEASSNRYEVDLPVEPLVVMADARRIEQVLYNLLSNAIKYSPERDLISIRASRGERQAAVQISDRGIGISHADQERVFERFYRVDHPITRSVRGVGLGLSICRGIVEAHGGRIWVESVPGQGSTFFFTLPLPDCQGAEGDKPSQH